MEPNEEPIKQDSLTPEAIDKWLSRAKKSAAFHRKQLIPKYKVAKRRYSSECGYSPSFKVKARHDDVNFLHKIIRDFIASIFNRNPQVDLTSRNQHEEFVRNIENLEQLVNDDIHDNQELKGLIRSVLVDEALAGFGALYVDYDYRQQESGEMVQGLNVPQANVLANEVIYHKILPENLIRPPWIKQWNWKSAPYLGYVDIVPLEALKQDTSLNQDVLAKVKGAVYKSLVDQDLREIEEKEARNEEMDDVLHARIYVLFVKGHDKGPLHRLVLIEDENVKGEALAYDIWDKGHGKDGRGFPIHLLMLNDAADGFIPPSEAWILETVLQIIDYLFDKLNRHLKKSTNKVFFKEGESGLKKPQVDKLVQNVNDMFIGVPDLPPQVDIRSVVTEVATQALREDHMQMYELARSILDNISRQPSFSKATVLNREKTATETEEIAADDNTENGDYIDKFRDFLMNLFTDHANLLQRNMQGVKNITITDEETGEEEPREVMKPQIQGEFNRDITIESFLPPNKALKRQQVKATLADLALMNPLLEKQGLEINGKKLTQEYAQNVDMRNPEEIVIPKVIRNIDQQVNDLAFKGIPFNPDELGNRFDEALKRLMEIFADDQMMAVYEGMRPGIGAGKGQPMGVSEEGQPQEVQADGDIVAMIKFLDRAVNKGTGQEVPEMTAA